MKRTIRLRESELRHMISESVKRVLTEMGKSGVFNDNGEYMGYENHEDFGTEYDDNDSQFDSPDNWYDDLMDDLYSLAKEKVVKLVKNINQSGKSISALNDFHNLDSDEEYCYIKGDNIVYKNDINDLIFDLYDGNDVPNYNWSPDMQEVEFKFNIKDICREANVELPNITDDDDDDFYYDANHHAMLDYFRKLGIDNS